MFSAKDRAKALEKLLEKAILDSAPKREFGILFSAGIDSMVLALLCKKLGLRFKCFFGYLDGLGKPKDLAFAEKAAKLLGFRLETASVHFEKLPGLIKKVVSVVESTNPVTVGIALPLFLACSKARQNGIKAIFSGQGADELFFGYARFRESKNLKADSMDALEKLKQEDLKWNKAISSRNKQQLLLPFLDEKVEEFALSLPKKFKISKGQNKSILRELALSLGLPKEFADRKKVAAQYGSNFDKALEKLAKKEKKNKTGYLQKFQKKKFLIAALFSGGKDSNYALWLMQKENKEVKCLVAILPENKDSFMYHKPHEEIIKMQSIALGIPLIIEKTVGEKEIELGELKKALQHAKQKFGIKGVVSGALYSNYQKSRIQKICNELHLRLFSPLWHGDQAKEILDLVENGFVFIMVKIAALGLSGEWLGKPIEKQDVEKLAKIGKDYGFNVAGEGGEFESIVLDAPNFSKRIVIEKSEKKMQNAFTGELEIKKAGLAQKN